MRVALVRELGGIGSVELRERPDPTPAAGQAVVRVRGAGVGPWDVAMISGALGRPALPYIPGFEVAGVVEAVGDGADVQPGDRVYANLGVAGGGFAEYALADTDRLARMPQQVSFEEAAGLVVGFAGAVLIFTPWQTASELWSAGGLECLAASVSYEIGRAHV